MDASAASNEPPRVGLRDLRHDARTWVDRAAAGERVYVTDRGRVVAELVPHRSSNNVIDRLVAEGRAIPPIRPARRIRRPTGPVSTRLSDALQAMRDEEYE
jgi:antitoxin (DNA-binding transcriptional repressor) of toxin-antitoxin stability system